MKDTSKIKMQLQCPLPKLDFEYITLGHGSGGLLTHKLLESGVFDLLSNEYLDKQDDGAFLTLKHEIAITTDSFVISPIFFPGGNIGELSVFGTVNDLAMCGADPKYLTLSFIIEEGLLFKEFWEVLVGIKWAADKANVKIVTGDTKVVDRGKADKIFINTTGIGEVHSNAKIDINRIKVGDKIICSGNVATHGMAIMSVREGLEFESTIESDTQELNHLTAALIKQYGSAIKFLRDPTRGGLGTILAEISKDTNVGIDVLHDSIPIDPLVFSACELLGLDPIYVANEGIFICIIDGQVAEDATEFLQKLAYGENAAIIGEIVEDHPNKTVLVSPIGGRRVINLPVGEQLPRIC